MSHVVTKQVTTTVTTQGGGGGTVVTTGNRDWSSGTFACFDDIKSCLCGIFCGPCLLCMVSKRIGENMCVGCCVPGGIIALRVRLRSLLGIQGTICNDCLCSYFCGPCVACQMYREETHAGLTS
ncbi:unnamed protein product [Owenia fusiformis]|uniref:Uncharacterized protein n=1 Tax=Owenia fusiformis TaxID=6347 RepID=A0A8J1XVF7_OWEFU|nr:unnamed protein product [Owenia fusiformis]